MTKDSYRECLVRCWKSGNSTCLLAIFI